MSVLPYHVFIGYFTLQLCSIYPLKVASVWLNFIVIEPWFVTVQLWFYGCSYNNVLFFCSLLSFRWDQMTSQVISNLDLSRSLNSPNRNLSFLLPIRITNLLRLVRCALSRTNNNCLCLSDNTFTWTVKISVLLCKHQWNTRWAFMRNDDILTC